MEKKVIDAFWDRENLYKVNYNFGELFKVVEAIKDVSLELVNEGKLTEEQFANLQIQLNGLLKKGDISIHDINKNLGKIDQTFLTDELLKQIAGTASVNATVADNSLTTSKFADKAVTADKTNFIKTSNNLLNKNDVITNKNLDVSNGNEITSGTASIFNKWFELVPGGSYVSAGLYARVFYDANKNYISGATGNSAFTVPSNAKFTRFSTTNLDAAQLNEGSALKAYEAYVEPTLSSDIAIKSLPDNIIDTPKIINKSVTPEKVSFIEQSKNLIDKNKMIQGYAITATSNGEPVANSTQYVTDFIKITPNQQYTASTNSHRVTFYDIDKKYVSQLYSADQTKYTFTTPPNAAYLRINVYTTRANDPILNVGSEILPYEDWHEPLLKGVKVEGSTNNQTVTPTNLKSFILDEYLKTNYTPVTIDGISDTDTLPAGQIKYTDYYTYYDKFVTDFPDYVSKKLEGTDSSGKEIYSYRFKPEQADYTQNSNAIERPYRKPKLFLVSSTHGNERVIIWALYNFMKQICNNWKNDEALEFMRWNVEFIVIPIINPTGYTNATRINGNGVDLNRNFPSDWANGTSDSTQTTYRGPSALSEKEAVICDNILKNEKPDFVVDYHNFHTPPKTNYFNWIIGYNDKVNEIASHTLSSMARKWKKNYSDLPQDSRQFGYISPGIEVGSLTNHAQKAYGISSALFEVCWRLEDKPDWVNRDSFVCTIATDSLANFLIRVVTNINKL
ncbi:M14 family metallopeptidase [Staphylococcus simulans]|uniref:M14 family metallopeptidase n=1 Tax=Staphylococcus simulans TaxID=1286 RepID=UPI0021D125F4|nr:M14 family metallopeptidase [Staphylococcus simulans]UXR29346.1 M14 family metallopeptidase [Staphylococcus simulans]